MRAVTTFSATVAALHLLLTVALCSGHTVRAGQFKDKVVLVTGGASGIGLATAMAFARDGARVIIAGRDSHPTWWNLSSAERAINMDPRVQSSNGYCRSVKADMSVLSEARSVIANIANKEGDLDIAVNNAGIGGPLGRVDTIGQYVGGAYDPIRNNVYSCLNSMVAETEWWVKSGKREASIVNVASVNGIKATPRGCMYGASKHAIIGLTKSVALEFAKGTPKIRVNALAPGFTATPLTWNQAKTMEDNNVQMWEEPAIWPDHPLWKKWEPMFLSHIPSGEMATAEQQADAILYLSSEEASYVSGTTLVVDFAGSA